MLKTIDPEDIQISEFITHKTFTFTDADSGSGVYGLEGLSGSLFNFQTGSAASQSFGTYNVLSASLGLLPYSLGTFYKLPIYFSTKHKYYNNSSEPFKTFGGNDTKRNFREIYNRVNVITIPQQYYGEGIKPGSIKLTDNSSDVTFDIRDDGDGNLYDWRYSSSYANFKSSSFDNSYRTTAGSGSAIGNIFYSQGIITIVDTGSYVHVGLSQSSDGFELDFRSTHTIYEHEYTCRTELSDFNSTVNISSTLDRSGSVAVSSEVLDKSPYFPPGDNPSGAGTGSLASVYNATDTYIGRVTHSFFAPYVSTVGLYDDFNQLLAIGRLAKPIRNDPALALSFVIRFDT